ncbi:hypothetical protein QH494_23750 [Sphingomonas sp. AR_OL41]|uniref:hypothetical protein n=1 Tax=Sphingomonas sp. AR_OL41 TaxID=3042729 RepID=UPI0024818E71|nr:hypothetical protein [Sphingomonas sp. AR_OL41]MDH7975210.1 hypothetical protein [Sphingomonas sp. AR_OL41]
MKRPFRLHPNCRRRTFGYSAVMKKGHGLKRALQPVEREQLGDMPTGALLARLKRLRWCEETREESDLSEEEVASAANLILFKSDPEWRSAYSDIRDELTAREHIGNKP